MNNVDHHGKCIADRNRRKRRRIEAVKRRRKGKRPHR